MGPRDEYLLKALGEIIIELQLKLGRQEMLGISKIEVCREGERDPSGPAQTVRLIGKIAGPTGYTYVYGRNIL